MNHVGFIVFFLIGVEDFVSIFISQQRPEYCSGISCPKCGVEVCLEDFDIFGEVGVSSGRSQGAVVSAYEVAYSGETLVVQILAQFNEFL